MTRATQTLTWTPADTTSHTFTVSVTDGDSVYEQTFTVPVEQPPASNDPPEITSIPTGPAFVNEVYTYQVLAHDPDGDTLTFSLDTASLSEGIAIHPDSGLLTWEPNSNHQDNTYEISVTVDDQISGTYTQTFDLPVVGPADSREQLAA